MNRWARMMLLALGTALLAGPVLADDSAAEEAPRLSVRGEALLEVPADQARLQLGVTSVAPDAEVALAEAAARVRRVEAALERLELGEDAVQTGSLRVQPEWSPRPRQAEPDWRPAIIAYRVTHQLNVRTSRLDLLGKLIAAATEAGATEVSGLQFGLADPRQYRDRAIRAATGEALEDAASLARAAGVRLGRVLSLSLDQAAVTPQRVASEAYAGARLMAMDAAPPITPGEVQVRAQVQLVCAIDD